LEAEEMQIDDLSKDFVKSMSDEEVNLWFGVLKQQETIKQMRQALLQYLDLQEADKDAKTIKFPGGRM
jgi:hypothetical protein